MGYLLPMEYVQYGLTAETTDDWVTMASAMIDAHCRRPSLLVTQYVERLRLPAGSQALRLSYRPLVVAPGNSSALVGVRVRYGKPRKGETEDPFREQVAWAFGLPGSWSSLDPGSVDVNMANGEVTFVQNLLGLNYNEAEITYTAGFVTVPVAIKVACAQIVKNAQATPATNVRFNKLESLQMEYFSSVLIDEQVQAVLRPYVAERLG
jgi:hypothetical protein